MTALCVITGCRIRGQHQADCDDEQCPGCLPRTTDDGHACQRCTDRTRDRLYDIDQQTPDARLVAAGLVRRGDGGGSGKPESRPPLNDDATDALDDVQARLVALVREIADTRGLTVPRQAGRDGILVAARWLAGQIDWMRHAVDGHEPYAIAAWAEIGDCASRIRGIVNGPSAQRFLGPCGAEVTWDEDDNEVERDQPCDGDVYAYPGAAQGVCRSCRARWSTEARTAWLDGEVRQRAFRAAHIADAYGIPVKTIRSWADRHQLLERGKDREERPLYLLGDVLDLAAESAARRLQARAQRERRAAEHVDSSTAVV